MIRFFPFLLAAALFAGGCRDAASTERRAAAPADTTAAEEALRPQPDSAAAEQFRQLVSYAQAENLSAQPTGAVMQALGEQLIGAPYVVGPLDGTDEETLVCRLDGFDCYTFVDAMLAMARGVTAGDYSYDGYARRTLEQRYRGGEKDGYCSRLHYFTEWIADNARRGHLRSITREIGGEPLEKDLSFMTEHRDRYPRFADDGSAAHDSLFQCIRGMEARLDTLTIYHVPQARIAEVYDRLQAGDVVAFSTDIGGLDVTHTGLVYKGADGSTGLLHASTSGGVKVSPDLQRYVENVPRQVGIVVARPARE